MIADCVLFNGRILTLDSKSTVASALAIAGSRIAAIGPEEDIRRTCGPQTRLVDLRGRTAMPGLIDGHAHMDREALKGLLPSLEGVRRIDSLVSRLREITSQVPAGTWVVTRPLGDPPLYRSSPELFAEGRLPTRHDLDQASSDHPILIRAAWGYWARQSPLITIANSKALELAGIGRSTGSPSSKVSIERDARGEPTGVFLETDPMPIVEFTLFRSAPNFSVDDRVNTLAESMRIYNSFGTTSVFEGHGSAPEVIRAYQRLREQHRQSVRAQLVFSPAWSGVSSEDVRGMVASWGQWLATRGLGDEWLRVAGLYTEVDESPEGRLRARCAPRTGWAGFCFDSGLPRQAVKELMLECARQGVRVCGIWEDLLDLFTDVDREIAIGGQRWVLGHQTFLDAEKIARIRDLGLVLTTHTQIHKRGASFLTRAGKGREATIYPMRDLLDAGIPVSLGTDNVPPTVWFSVWEVTERIEGGSGQAISPSQKISREEALRCATSSGAWLCLDEQNRGSLEAGKLADVAVFDEDPLGIDPDGLRDLTAAMTVVGGRITYSRIGSQEVPC
jgi:predicted amidohydrolase YtcJ